VAELPPYRYFSSSSKVARSIKPEVMLEVDDIYPKQEKLFAYFFTLFES